MRSTFINCLLERAAKDDRIFVLTPDMGFSVLEKFRAAFPDRFLNVGIAEQNAIGVAAGLALSGKMVYVYIIIPFVTMLCFEQVRVDLAYMKTNVRLFWRWLVLWTSGSNSSCDRGYRHYEGASEHDSVLSRRPY